MPGARPTSIVAHGVSRHRHGSARGRLVRNAPLPAHYRFRTLNYGDKYAHKFRDKLRPSLSAAGQAWLDCTLRAVQTVIEDRQDRDPLADRHVWGG
jgi:hypothetical protein